MLTRLRWSAFGLRGRIVGMVLVTTVATLVVAAIGLLPRLESSLRNAAKTTLTTDVEKAIKPHGQIVKFMTCPEHAGVLPARRPLAASDDPQASSPRRGGRSQGRASSRRPSAPTSLVLIGFIDPTGAGQVVSLQTVRDRWFDEIQRDALAWHLPRSWSREIRYRTRRSAARQYVRAAIPLPTTTRCWPSTSRSTRSPTPCRAVRHAFELAAAGRPGCSRFCSRSRCRQARAPPAGACARRRCGSRVAGAGAGSSSRSTAPATRSATSPGRFAIMQRRLRQQEEARRAFVATASHELRTPLTSLDGMLELLDEDLRDEPPDLAGRPGPARARPGAVAPARAARRRSARPQPARRRGGAALRAGRAERARAARCSPSSSSALSERGVGASCATATGPVWALADPGSVARILRILLDNAAACRAARQRASTSPLTGGPAPTLSVIDHGPGRRAEERELIFERFKRGRDTGGEAGFGLGLAIGRELAERMGGTLVLRRRRRSGRHLHAHAAGRAGSDRARSRAPSAPDATGSARTGRSALTTPPADSIIAMDDV